MKIEDINIKIYKDASRGLINRLKVTYNKDSYIIAEDDDHVAIDDGYWCVDTEQDSIKNMIRIITDLTLSIIYNEDIPSKAIEYKDIKRKFIDDELDYVDKKIKQIV